MELVNDIFRRSKEENKVISVFLNGEDADFWCGIIQDFNDEFIVINHYTKYGHFDGLIIEQIANIEQVSFESHYCKGMEYLIKNNQQLYRDTEINVEVNLQSNWRYEILEQQLNNANRAVKIEIHGNTIHCGLIKWLDADNVIMNMIEKDGEDDGSSIFKIEDITMIRVNDLDSRRKLLLYKFMGKSR
jgi:hypothetical protein